MPDTPAALAREILREATRAEAVVYAAGVMFRAPTPRQSWRALRVMAALLIA